MSYRGPQTSFRRTPLWLPRDDRPRPARRCAWGARSSVRPWLIPPELEVAFCRSWTGRAAPRFDSPRDDVHVERHSSPGGLLLRRTSRLPRVPVTLRWLRARDERACRATLIKVHLAHRRRARPRAPPELSFNFGSGVCLHRTETMISLQRRRVLGRGDFLRGPVSQLVVHGSKTHKVKKSS